jgi:hypothetical protein
MYLSSKTWGMGMAAATASIAVVGAWYGAGLKENQENKQVRGPPQPTLAVDTRINHCRD